AAELPQLLVGDGGGLLRPESTEDRDVDDVETDQDQAGQDGADVEVADRHAHDVAQQHQDDAGRDDLPQGTRSADCAGDQPLVVPAPHHRGQRYQAHGDDAGPDDPGGGSQDGAHHYE